MQLIAYQNIKRKNSLDSMIIARTFVVLPTDVPMNSNLSYDEYRQQYLVNAKRRFEQHLNENGKDNVTIYGYAQSRMNDVVFDD